MSQKKVREIIEGGKDEQLVIFELEKDVLIDIETNIDSVNEVSLIVEWIESLKIRRQGWDEVSDYEWVSKRLRGPFSTNRDDAGQEHAQNIYQGKRSALMRCMSTIIWKVSQFPEIAPENFTKIVAGWRGYIFCDSDNVAKNIKSLYGSLPLLNINMLEVDREFEGLYNDIFLIYSSFEKGLSLESVDLIQKKTIVHAATWVSRSLMLTHKHKLLEETLGFWVLVLDFLNKEHQMREEQDYLADCIFYTSLYEKNFITIRKVLFGIRSLDDYPNLERLRAHMLWLALGYYSNIDNGEHQKMSQVKTEIEAGVNYFIRVNSESGWKILFRLFPRVNDTDVLQQIWQRYHQENPNGELASEIASRLLSRYFLNSKSIESRREIEYYLNHYSGFISDHTLQNISRSLS